MRRITLISVVFTLAFLTPALRAQDVRYYDLGRGPVSVYVPTGYDDSTPLPLVVLLHGYGGSSHYMEAVWGLQDYVDTYRFILAIPEGTMDGLNRRFWNATDACCDFNDTNVDDEGYLLALVDAIKADGIVDDRRLSFAGWSNGGFMSHRMACRHPDLVASIASLAGVTFANADDCEPWTTVHTLQIHGTEDTYVNYEGGEISGVPYPGAIETAEIWAANNGCAVIPDDSAPPLDLDQGIAGDETLVTRYLQDCAPGGSSELWTIVGGAHQPYLSDSFAPLVIEWLLEHPSPCPADFNGDGIADTRDFVAYLAAWSDQRDDDCSQGGCSADTNGDGVVDSRDFVEFLNLWATGC